jgi:PAS domain S-box-containing protein
MAKVMRCHACGGELAGSATCPSCGAEPPAGGIDQTRDQAASDRDRTAEHRDRSAERRDRGADDRDAMALEHEQAASDREGVASDQDRSVVARKTTQRDRDDASVGRDGTTAAGLDGRAADPSPSDTPSEAAHDRQEAADDREHAAGDREEAANDRQEAAGDREEALRDRTKAAAAAQRAVETLESMSDAFFTLDSDWRFTYLNPQTEAVLGRRRDDLLGQNVWEAFPETVGSRSYDQYQRALRDRIPVRFEEAWPPGGPTFEVRAYPVPRGLAVYFTDVTEERLRDDRLRQAQRLEAIGRVTASVAHDFHNILAAVGGFAALGQAVSVDAQTRTYFDEIDSASRRAVALTRQLLVFAREQDLDPAFVDLNVVVGDLVSLLQQLVPEDIELRLALSPEPVPVFVDRSQLEQVLLNLVVNSRDAIETVGSITISTTSDEPAGVKHDVHVPSGWLQVSDTGAGIPEEAIPLIFDPFFSTKPRETGAGLGLATIYGIVSQSEGSIFVESTVGVGTTMTLALPSSARRPTST